MLPFIKGYSIAADSRTLIHCAAESIGAVRLGEARMVFVMPEPGHRPLIYANLSVNLFRRALKSS